jgi:hypothetical protein
MSDTKILRYRSNAVALSRAGEQCRKILEAMQANRDAAPQPVTVPAPVIPVPVIAAAPPPAVKAQPALPSVANKPGAQPSTPQAPAAPSRIGPSRIGPSRIDDVSLFPDDIETMKRHAREMLAAFSAQPVAIFPNIPDPAALIDAAVRQAFASAKTNAAA